MKELTAVILLIAVIVGIIYGGFIIKRKWNYNLGYKTLVEQTIRDMVKPEALK
jgi:uncharacterized protein YneF (UPF0154 family)